MQSKVAGLDVEQLKAEISKTYTAVSLRARARVHLSDRPRMGRGSRLPGGLLARVPDTACESFAGVANPFSLGGLSPGEHVLDLGSGAGMDSLVAAQMVGAEGSVTGIDMTPAMLERARRAADELGAANVSFVHGEAEGFPSRTSFDVVISNGVVDLIPDKDAVFAELYRVLRPAAVCSSPTSRSSVRSARKANATSTSGPVELPALCWKQSTQTGSRGTASSASRPAT